MFDDIFRCGGFIVKFYVRVCKVILVIFNKYLGDISVDFII